MTGDSSEAEVWLHLIKPITAGLIDAPRLKLMRRLRDGAALRFRVICGRSTGIEISII